jgi:hypothetical protein
MLVIAAAGGLPLSLGTGEPQLGGDEKHGEEDGRPHGDDLELS